MKGIELSAARKAVHVHTALLAAWGAAIPLSFFMGWLESVVFVSAASIYANLATHWAGRQAALAEEATPGER